MALHGVGGSDLWESNLKEEPNRALVLEGEGKVPKYISGHFIRNGPGLFEEMDTGGKGREGREVRRYTHIFDELAKLHAFDIQDGHVGFS